MSAALSAIAEVTLELGSGKAEWVFSITVQEVTEKKKRLICMYRGFPGGSVVKNQPVMQETAYVCVEYPLIDLSLCLGYRKQVLILTICYVDTRHLSHPR